MNLVKEEVRLSVLHEIGVVMDDQKEACGKQAEQLCGGKQALMVASKHIEKLLGLADSELDDGTIENIAQLSLVKRWIQRAMDSVLTQARHLELQEVAMRGRCDQATRTVELVKKRHEDGRNRLQNLLKAIEAEQVGVEDDGEVEHTGTVLRMPGVRPGMSLAQKRKVEDAQAKVEGEAVQKSDVELKPESTEETEPEPKAKARTKRTRKPKT